MVWPFSRAVTEEEAATLRRRCASRASALAVCVKANEPRACAAFAEDLELCRATVLCKTQADAFMACVSASEAAALIGGPRPDCTQQSARMSRCLRGFALPKK